MPAVQLSRLRNQITTLSWKFTRPEEFRHDLKELLEFYGQRVYRAGQSLKPAQRIPAYHVPALVLRQLELELVQFCNENPSAALAVADALWQDNYLETKMMAAYILGQVPESETNHVIERFKNWCQQNEDRNVINILLERGSSRIRKKAPDKWLNLIQNWLNNHVVTYQRLGLRALLPLINDKEFDNLPPVFVMLSPIFQNYPKALQTELSDLAEALAKHSPAETSYFLRQILSITENSNTARMIRQILPGLPAELQENLRKTIKNMPSS